MRAFVFLLSLLPAVALAAGGGANLMEADIDLSDKDSLKRGAQLYVDYCMGCHSLKYLRYNRMGEDLGISDDELTSEYIFTDAKVGDTMTIAMPAKDAENWFGVAPPDLSLVARSRGIDWLYTYLLSFYKDDSRPFGVNNLVFPDVGMPHVLWEMEGGVSTNDGHGKLTPADPAKHEEYKKQVTDLVNFFEYAGEPGKMARQSLGIKVMIFLIIFSIIAYILKKEYWKDIK
jgi:ubiquinol-cytochrome c reductase cytochrome c1 subunit